MRWLAAVIRELRLLQHERFWFLSTVLLAAIFVLYLKF